MLLLPLLLPLTAVRTELPLHQSFSCSALRVPRLHLVAGTSRVYAQQHRLLPCTTTGQHRSKPALRLRQRSGSEGEGVLSSQTVHSPAFSWEQEACSA